MDVSVTTVAAGPVTTVAAAASAAPGPGPIPVPNAGYVCAQCGKRHQLTMRDNVQCTACGYRIMYKRRSTEKLKYSAR